jgi:hypothetical protein
VQGKLGSESSTVSRLSFAGAFRYAVADIRSWVYALRGTHFQELSNGKQDEVLQTLESSSRLLGGVPGTAFFATLLTLTKAGFLRNPDAVRSLTSASLEVTSPSGPLQRSQRSGERCCSLGCGALTSLHSRS